MFATNSRAWGLVWCESLKRQIDFEEVEKTFVRFLERQSNTCMYFFSVVQRFVHLVSSVGSHIKTNPVSWKPTVYFKAKTELTNQKQTKKWSPKYIKGSQCFAWKYFYTYSTYAWHAQCKMILFLPQRSGNFGLWSRNQHFQEVFLSLSNSGVWFSYLFLFSRYNLIDSSKESLLLHSQISPKGGPCNNAMLESLGRSLPLICTD